MRTVKCDVKELKGFLTQYHIGIESRPSYGYRYNFQRVIYIINRLLIGKPYYKAGELMGLFYVSRPILTRELNRARILLSKSRLEIDVNLRKGIGVIGLGPDGGGYRTPFREEGVTLRGRSPTVWRSASG